MYVAFLSHSHGVGAMPAVFDLPAPQNPPTTYDCAYEHSLERYFLLEKMIEAADRDAVIAEPKVSAKAAAS